MTYVERARKLLIDREPGLSDELADLYTLLVITTGTDTTLRQTHDAWSVWRSRSSPDHACIVPFEELSPEQQAKDGPWMRVIHAVARTISDKQWKGEVRKWES